MSRPVTIFSGQWADLPFEKFCEKTKSFGYDGPLSVEWEDSGMEREYDAKEACEFVRRVNLSPSDVAFDSALKTD